MLFQLLIHILILIIAVALFKTNSSNSIFNYYAQSAVSKPQQIEKDLFQKRENLQKISLSNTW